MKRLEPEVIDFYNDQVVTMITEKYGIDEMTSFKMFVNSRTHEMLENEDYGMTDFGAPAIFDMWECEKITGKPQNSIYIRQI